MLVNLLVEVVESLFHLLAGILLDDFTQLLLVEGQLVAHLLLADALSHAGLDSFEEMLQAHDRLAAATLPIQTVCEVHVNTKAHAALH